MKKYLLLTLIIGLSGCVSQKKYDALASKKTSLEQENAALEESLMISRKKSERLQATIDQLVKDSLSLYTDLQETKDALSANQEKYEKLQTYYDDMLKNSGELNQNLAEKQQQLMELEIQMEQAKKRNEDLRTSLEEREQKVNELETILAEKDNAVRKLKNLVSEALLNFEENELSVEIRNGKVYVSLSEQLLFKSGSIAVDPTGKEALNILADALENNNEINIMVEGHTDNVPVSRISQYMKNNWDLSVMRATSIVKILTEAGVAPEQIIAAGRGEYQPLTSNETANGRQRNRRTEIILTPKLDELFQILQTN